MQIRSGPTTTPKTTINKLGLIQASPDIKTCPSASLSLPSLSRPCLAWTSHPNSRVCCLPPTSPTPAPLPGMGPQLASSPTIWHAPMGGGRATVSICLLCSPFPVPLISGSLHETDGLASMAGPNGAPPCDLEAPGLRLAGCQCRRAGLSDTNESTSPPDGQCSSSFGQCPKASPFGAPLRQTQPTMLQPEETRGGSFSRTS